MSDRISDRNVDMDPREAEMDSLLRRSMAAPVPRISSDFHQRLAHLTREVHIGSRLLDRYQRILLTGYGLSSVAASAVVMRGQGLGWGAISVLIFVPLAVVAITSLLRRTTSTTVRCGAA
jgi:hypothetical protein